MSNQNENIEMDNPNTVCPKVQMVGYGDYTGQIIWGELVAIRNNRAWARLNKQSGKILEYDLYSGIPEVKEHSGFIINSNSYIFDNSEILKLMEYIENESH
jgi:hypothetical protein